MEPRDDAELEEEEERIGKWIDLMSTDLQMKVRQRAKGPDPQLGLGKSTTLT